MTLLWLRMTRNPRGKDAHVEGEEKGVGQTVARSFSFFLHFNLYLFGEAPKDAF